MGRRSASVLATQRSNAGAKIGSHLQIRIFWERAPSFGTPHGPLVGGDDYLVKPFDPNELLERVRRLLPPRLAEAPVIIRHAGLAEDLIPDARRQIFRSFVTNAMMVSTWPTLRGRSEDSRRLRRPGRCRLRNRRRPGAPIADLIIAITLVILKVTRESWRRTSTTEPRELIVLI